MDFLNFSLTKETLPVVREFAEHIPGGFVIYQENKDRDILFVNRPLIEIYQCDTVDEFRELTGNTFPGMVHPDDFDRVQASIDTQIGGKHGKVDHVEYRIFTKTGEIRWIDDYGHFSHSDDYGDLYYVFLIDITEKKLAQEFENNFFFKMAHELLTPMNLVSSFIKLAQNHLDDPDLLQDYLQKADNSSGDMTILLNRMLEIRAETDKEENQTDPEIPAAFEPTEITKKIRVLIVEDNDINQLLLSTILEESGFETEAAYDGGPAFEMVRDHEPGYYDVILMDLQMKDVDGYQATEMIRKLPHCGMEEFPIIALSANCRDEDIERSTACHMNAHLAKPYQPDLITKTILDFCGK